MNNVVEPTSETWLIRRIEFATKELLVLGWNVDEVANVVYNTDHPDALEVAEGRRLEEHEA